jgi:hypothetical protein
VEFDLVLTNSIVENGIVAAVGKGALAAAREKRDFGNGPSRAYAPRL